MSVTTNKNLATEIAPHIYSASRDLQMENILLLFLEALVQKFTVTIWHRYYYILLNKLFGLGFI